MSTQETGDDFGFLSPPSVTVKSWLPHSAIVWGSQQIPDSGPYEYRVQSHLFSNDHESFDGDVIQKLLSSDLLRRTTQASERLASVLFPDTAFGFPINEMFIEKFHGVFLTNAGLIDSSNFSTELKSSIFLNQVVSTITKFLHDTKNPVLGRYQPLRFFSPIHANTPIQGTSLKRKPDMMVISLVDGHIKKGSMLWPDVQSFIETTREGRPPIRMKDTIVTKSYLMFCNQPERDFVISMGITSQGFKIFLIDRAGIITTDVIPFNYHNCALVFIRMVMGLAFLPDSYIGVDATMNFPKLATPGKKFEEAYPPLVVTKTSPSMPVFDARSLPSWLTVHGVEKDDRPTISVGEQVYPVKSTIFRSQSLVGRGTTVFVVKLPDGTLGVLKDSWNLVKKPTESLAITKLDLPFCPRFVDDHHFKNAETARFRTAARKEALIDETRIKERMVMYPAGVHISDFSSLWELMIAFLDVIIAISCLESNNKLHRDISYTNLLLRDRGVDSAQKTKLRDGIKEEFGLVQIEKMREDFNCREGLLIDFDHATTLLEDQHFSGNKEDEDNGDGDDDNRDRDEANGDGDEANRDEDEANGDEDEANGNGDEVNDEWVEGSVMEVDSFVELQTTQQTQQTTEHADVANHPSKSGVRTGTAPFIATEILMFGVPHQVMHDIESVFFVLLFICTHLDGPHHSIRSPPLLGPRNVKHPSPMTDWLQRNKFSTLGHVKASHMNYFRTQVLPHISPFFQPLTKYLTSFWDALHPSPFADKSSDTPATLKCIVQIFKTALEDPELIKGGERANTVLGKRARPGELGVSGWDAVEIPQKKMVSPRIVKQTKRKAKPGTK